MQGSWSSFINPDDPNQIIIERHPASIRKIGPFGKDELRWVTDRLHAREAFEANLVAHPYQPVKVDPLIDQLRQRREELGLTYADVATPMGMASTRIKSAEEGLTEPKWSNIKLWAWLLGFDIQLKRKGIL